MKVKMTHGNKDSSYPLLYAEIGGGEEEEGDSSTVLRILTILRKLIYKLNNLFCHTSN